MSYSPNPASPDAPALVVDDDPRIREIIQWALEDAGLAVEPAADGREALEKATRRRPALVVLDMMLPGLDGTGLAARLRGLCGSTLPILVVTADGQAPEKARRVGAFAYFGKPFDVDDLVAAVQRGLDSA